MAHSCVAGALATLLALAGSVSGQTACLGSAPHLLEYSCYLYLYEPSVAAPSSFCCAEVISLTTDYGADCLCQFVLYEQANPETGFGIIPGRLYNLAGDCSAHADMSNCSTPPSANPAPAAVTTAPASTSTTPGVTTPPGDATPTLEVPSAPSSGSRALTGALVGGSVGGVSVLGVVVYILVKCLQSSKFEFKWDVNAPCCCCQRRENPHPSSAGKDSEGVSYPAPYQAPYPAPYRAPYPAPYRAPYPVPYRTPYPVHYAGHA